MTFGDIRGSCGDRIITVVAIVAGLGRPIVGGEDNKRIEMGWIAARLHEVEQGAADTATFVFSQRQKTLW